MGKDKLRLLHILPVTAEGIMSAEAEEDMRRYLAEGTEVVHRQVTGGAETIQCEYDAALSAPHAAELAAEECAAGEIDGVFIDCFADPGVRAARERLELPVMGGFEPAIYLGLGLGDNLGIITIRRNIVPLIRGGIARAGVGGRIACVRTLDMSVLELREREKLMERLHRECLEAIEADGAEVLILGCTAAVGVGGELARLLRADGHDVPVLEAAQCSLALTELYARMGLYQSRVTYMAPPGK